MGLTKLGVGEDEISRGKKREDLKPLWLRLVIPMVLKTPVANESNLRGRDFETTPCQ